MSSSLVQRLKSIGPGALVAAGFIGPGTVTTCTVSGANYGYTMLWALLFATVATIIFQEMAARIGIVSQKGLGENIRDRIPNKALMWIAIVVVLIAIFVLTEGQPAVLLVARNTGGAAQHVDFAIDLLAQLDRVLHRRHSGHSGVRARHPDDSHRYRARHCRICRHVDRQL